MNEQDVISILATSEKIVTHLKEGYQECVSKKYDIVLNQIGKAKHELAKIQRYLR